MVLRGFPDGSRVTKDPWMRIRRQETGSDASGQIFLETGSEGPLVKQGPLRSPRCLMWGQVS